jgi:hypothetical protein
MKFLIIFCYLFPLPFFYQSGTAKQTAEVKQIEGLYVFTDCTPVSPYETLGEVFHGAAVVEDYEGLRNSFIRKVKKKFPTANGIILHLKSGDIRTDARYSAEGIVIK